MRDNGTISQREIPFPNGEILVSKTDLKGVIQSCNRAFIDISGFSESELLGQNHNMVRHADMPVEAFADMWKTLRDNRPWSGVVKNRAKSGDHYWVLANVTPLFQSGETIGYMSVRTEATRAQIAQAEKLYANLKIGKGSLEPRGFGRVKAWLNSVSTARLLYSIIIATVLTQVLTATLLINHAPLPVMLALLFSCAIVAIIGGVFAVRRSVKPLQYVVGKMKQMVSGEYFNWVEHDRHDEFGDLMDSLKILQIQTGFEILDSKERANRSNRIRTALDNVETNVMIADANYDIIYFNKSLEVMFQGIEADLKKSLPDFDAHDLMGSNIDQFHKHPEHQRGMLEHLKETYATQIEVNGVYLGITATPVFDENGRRSGTVVEWANRTAQVEIENEVQQVVTEAEAGNLTQRLNLFGKDDFFKGLCERINSLLAVNETVISDSIKSLSALASGDLTVKVEGQYAGAFNDLKVNINSTIEQLTTIIEQIQATTEALENGVEKISHGNRELTQRTTEQGSTLERSAAGMEQISGIVQSNAENSIEAAKLANCAKDTADNGGSVITEAITAMAEIGEASQRIKSITNVIDEIAFQTNLLALNAAVEAAHAGDHGRGFSVVATEVRNLAQRSAEAAKEVQDLVRDTMVRVDKGTAMVGKSGDTFNAILNSTSKVSEVIEEISNAGQEQSLGVQDINQTLVQLEQSTQENMQMVDETARASELLRDQARELTALVDTFKLESQQGRARYVA